MISVELFSGCGGLALGLAQAGFKHIMVAERDEHAVATLRENKQGNTEHFRDWHIFDGDIRNLDYSKIATGIDLVAGGPPCQPFSIGGKHGGSDDPRNMWPEAIRAVREIMPKAFLFENVRGLLRPAFRDYIEYIESSLTWPEVAQRKGEKWRDHAGRLEQHQMTQHDYPTYKVRFGAINAADYGAAQRRHRAIFVGIRSDIALDWTFPKPTHSKDALAFAQYTTGDYWKAHGVSPMRRRGVLLGDLAAIRRIQKSSKPVEKRWATVRDALSDLGHPTLSTECPSRHVLHAGARIYERHTGSRWDEPAKALKAGVHGVPGGENVLVHSNGRIRYFTLREMARLQGFPDEFLIPMGWKLPVRQLGNAVPIAVGQTFGRMLSTIMAPASRRLTNL